MNKVTFKTVDQNGNEIELAVVRPTGNHLRKAQIEYNRAFRENLEAGAMLRSRLEKYLRDQNMWDDKKQEERKALEKKILDGERRLAKGGFKFNEAVRLAKDMRRWRLELRDLLSDYTSLDNNTAEGQADNSRFNYLVSVCTVHNSNGEPYFATLSEYYNRADEQAAIDAATNLAQLMFGLNADHESSLPENKFLKKWKLVNDDLQFVDKDGNLVDTEGRRINKDGRYIDKDGNYVDRDGNRVDEEGNIVEEFEGFYDDEGNLLSEPTEEKRKEPEFQNVELSEAQV